MADDFLQPSDQVVLFMYIVTKGIPDWAQNNHVELFAKLMNWSPDEAQRAFDECSERGLIDKED